MCNLCFIISQRKLVDTRQRCFEDSLRAVFTNFLLTELLGKTSHFGIVKVDLIFIIGELFFFFKLFFANSYLFSNLEVPLVQTTIALIKDIAARVAENNVIFIFSMHLISTKRNSKEGMQLHGEQLACEKCENMFSEKSIVSHHRKTSQTAQKVS